MPKINDHYRPGLRCSFCGKSQEEVRKLIAGPDVYICDECIALCNEILAEEEGDDGAAWRAEGDEQADFAGALADGDGHDGADADATDEQ